APRLHAQRIVIHSHYSLRFLPSYNRDSFCPGHIQLTQPKEENALSMPRAQRAADTSLLEAALIGFEQMRRNVEEKMVDIRLQLGSRDGTRGLGQAPSRTRSPAARRRMAAAQRKRWAAVRAKSKSLRPAGSKRTMSAAGRKRIAAAQRKIWALLKAKKAS